MSSTSLLLERPSAHLYETGGLRRAHVRGHANVLKRLFVHAGAFNLALWMRTLFGVGTPRALQGRAAARLVVLSMLWQLVSDLLAPPTRLIQADRRLSATARAPYA